MIHNVLISVLLNLLVFSLTAQTPVFQAKPAGGKTWGYAGIDGTFLIEPQYVKCYAFSSEGLALIYDPKAKQHYCIDSQNKRLETEPSVFKSKDGACFQDGLLLVKIGDQWGYLNTAGKLAIPAKYDDGNEFNGGVAAVRKEERFFLLNTSGQETPVKLPVIDVKDFSEGLAPVRMADKKFGFIDSKGTLVIPAEYESVGYFVNGLAWAKTLDKKVGFIDKTGKWAIEPQFEAAKNFDPEGDMARVKKDGQWQYVHTNGTLMIVPDTETWGDFSEGLAYGKKGGLAGFFNEEGQWVIQPKFEAVRDFKNGYAAARLNGKWGLIDTEGNWAVEPKFDGIKDVVLVKK